MNDQAPTAAPVRPRGARLLKVAFANPKTASMLAFGFSSGLPYALIVGTVNAWLGEVGIKLATIGVLSWIGLAYAFKFLWSPLVDRLRVPLLWRLGRRKGWILACQMVLALSLAALALTDPAADIGRFAVFAVVAALASATQDVAVDAWRIDVADDATPVELLSAIYQFGYRAASLVGGALALVLAERMSWPGVFLVMAAVMLAVALLTVRAPDTSVEAARAAAAAASDSSGQLSPPLRLGALIVVGSCWAWALAAIGGFMISVLGETPAGATPPSAADFLKTTGPWIIAATVLAPLIVAAAVNWLVAQGRHVTDTGTPVHGAVDHLYGALIAPLAELVGRLGWGVLIVFGMILSYSMVFNIWAAFAFPFYLDHLHYSKDEVAFASKVFGIVMTMLGVSMAGLLFLRIGRLPTLLVGAALPILGNFIYADLADGGAHIDAVTGALGLNALAGVFGFDARMTRLLAAIAAENVFTGIAGAAFVAYVSSIVSKRFTAVQYALLSSLTFLIGSLGRGLAGEAFDAYGYGPVFRWTAAIGLFAVLFVLLEGARVRWAKRQSRL